VKRLVLVLAFATNAWAGDISVADLPAEARATLALIEARGPFPYRQDGKTFGNREKLLPRRDQGYYREYTVRTPGAQDRGARRIVAGSGGESYYTADHYRSFKRIRE
jgi:ribonuclease T1